MELWHQNSYIFTTFTFVHLKTQTRKQFGSIFSILFHFVPFDFTSFHSIPFLSHFNSFVYNSIKIAIVLRNAFFLAFVSIVISIFWRDLSIHQLHLSILYLRLIDTDLFIIIIYLWICIRCQNHFKKKTNKQTTYTADSARACFETKLI